MTVASIRTHNRRARQRAAMAPWLARLVPLAAGSRPDLAAATKRVLRARTPEGGPLRLAWFRGYCVPYIGPHADETTVILEQPRREPRRCRQWRVGPEGAAWWLLPDAAKR